MKAERIPHPSDDDEIIVSVAATAYEWRELLCYESWDAEKRIKSLLKGFGVDVD
jgi:hypothetical protein